MELYKLKVEREQRQSAIFKECGVFFAFSNQQFEENKTPLEEGDEYIRWIGGGFLPKSKAKQLMTSLKELGEWYKNAIADNNLRRNEIIYELSNHEAWYTGNLEDTINALGEGYTEEEVRNIFNEEYSKQSL